jgi:hypothetical protein
MAVDMQVIWVGCEEEIFFKTGLDWTPKSADGSFQEVSSVSIAKRANRVGLTARRLPAQSRMANLE